MTFSKSFFEIFLKSLLDLFIFVEKIVEKTGGIGGIPSRVPIGPWASRGIETREENSHGISMGNTRGLRDALRCFLER